MGMSSKQSRMLVWLPPLALLVAAIALELTGIVSIAIYVREWVGGELGRFAPRPDFADHAELLFLAAAGIAITIFFARGNVFLAGVVAVGAICSAIFISWRAEVDAQIYLDAAYPALVIAAIFALGRVLHVLQLSASRRKIRSTLAPRLSPAHAASVARDPERAGLPGQTRDLTYLVCRIRNFSALGDANALDAAGLAAFSRKVMTPMAQAILEKGGMIDHVGSGTITALFNAPLVDSKHATHACECALGMIEQLKKINRVMEKEVLRGVPYSVAEIGIGIETGPCAIGHFGTEDYPSYSAAGRAVEFAEELESLSEKYGPEIIVGARARAAAEGGFALLEVDRLSDGQNDEPVPIFALLGNSAVRSSPKFRALQTFHEHIFRTYRARQWAKTRALIEQCRALSGPDPILYDLYLDRIAYFESYPPAEDWDGVFRPPQI